MTKDLKNILLHGLRSTVFFFTFCFTATLAGAAMRNTTMTKYVEGFWTNRLYFQVNGVFALFCLFSMASVFSIHNVRLKELFGRICDAYSFSSVLKEILRDRFFWIESAVFAVMSFACTALSPMRDIIFGYLAGTKMAFEKKCLVAPLIFMVFFLVINFLAYHSTILWWLRTKEKKKASKSKNKFPPQLKLARQAFTTALIWILCGWTVSVVFPGIISTAGLAMLLIIPILLIVLTMLSWSHLRAIRIRAKCIKRLKAICKRDGLGLEIVGHPFSTLFVADHGAHVRITSQDKSYACRFIGIASRLTPMFLLDNGYALYGQNHIIFKHQVYEKFTFDANEGDKKLLVACPVPHALYTKNNENERLLDVGDKVLDYVVYNSSGFLNALERKCI